MEYCKCPNCGVDFKVYKCDTMPGCREMEEVYCPKCGQEVTKVFTSGIPQAYEEHKKINQDQRCC